jgi:hypothetical protein
MHRKTRIQITIKVIIEIKTNNTSTDKISNKKIKKIRYQIEIKILSKNTSAKNLMQYQLHTGYTEAWRKKSLIPKIIQTLLPHLKISNNHSISCKIFLSKNKNCQPPNCRIIQVKINCGS